MFIPFTVMEHFEKIAVPLNAAEADLERDEFKVLLTFLCSFCPRWWMAKSSRNSAEAGSSTAPRQQV